VYVTGPGAEDEDNDDDDYEDDIWDNGHYASSHLLGPHTEPQEAGIQLLHSGEFGRVSTKIKAQHGVHNIARILAHRGEYGRGKPTREDLESVSMPAFNAHNRVLIRADPHPKLQWDHCCLIR
jgi:WD repeat-containing protein 23